MKGLFQRSGRIRMNRPARDAKTEGAGEALKPPVVSALSANLLSLVTQLQKRMPLESLLPQLLKAMGSDATDTDRYSAAEALAGAVYPKFKFSEYGRIFLDDEAFLDYYRRGMDPGNWHSLDRKYTLDQLTKLVRHLNGDMAECGTYKGATAERLCLAAAQSGKTVHLFDSFEGLSAPGKRDGDYWFQGALQAPEAVVQKSLAEFANYRIYKGWIPDRFSEVTDRQFTFVHIDVDLYQPTLDSLGFFYPRTVSGGVILMDDYGFVTCPGAKQAADEFFSNKVEPVVMLTTGQALVIKR